MDTNSMDDATLRVRSLDPQLGTDYELGDVEARLARILAQDDEYLRPQGEGLDHLRANAEDREPRRHQQRNRTRSMALVACLSVIIAVAATLVVLHTTPAGSHRVVAPQWDLVADVSPSWHEVGAVSSNPGLSLTCPSDQTCYAADSQSSGDAGLSAIEVTNDGGRTWTASKLPVALFGLSVPLTGQTRIACASASTCAILGVSGSTTCANAHSCSFSNPSATFEETTDGGTTWATHAGPPGLTSLVDVSAMACPSAASCLAVASGYRPAATYVTTDGGTTWTTEQMPENFVPHDLQCSTASSCVVTGVIQSPVVSQASSQGTVLYTTDGGSAWKTASLPSGLGSPGTVSCPTATDCLATFSAADGRGSEVLTSTDGGATWSSVPASGLPEAAVLSTACPAAGQCWAAGVTDAQVSPQRWAIGTGATALLASTSNGGQTWQSSSAPAGVSLVASLSCPSAAQCYALAFEKPASGEFISVALLSYGN